MVWVGFGWVENWLRLGLALVGLGLLEHIIRTTSRHFSGSHISFGPNKWKYGPKPAVPWCFDFDPYPFVEFTRSLASGLGIDSRRRSVEQRAASAGLKPGTRFRVGPAPYFAKAPNFSPWKRRLFGDFRVS